MEPKPALAEEIDLPKTGPVESFPVAAEIVPAPTTVEPIKHEPLPEMRVERESFSEAWARHKRIMDAAKYETYVAQPVEDNPAEFDEPE